MENILDEIDKKILSELQEDSSISNLNLSKKIGLSPSACLSRTNNLVENGIIKKFTTIIDEKKVGMEVIAFVLVNLSPLNRENINSFLSDINDYPQVQECHTLTGSHDYLLKIVEKDMESYRDFIIDYLMNNKSISRVETNIVMSVEKRTISIPIERI